MISSYVYVFSQLDLAVKEINRIFLIYARVYSKRFADCFLKFYGSPNLSNIIKIVKPFQYNDEIFRVNYE